MGVIKTIVINSRSIEVSELTMQDIHDIVQHDNLPGNTFAGSVAMLLERCTSLKRDEVLPYHPSDLQPLIDTMIEVNRAFFVQAAAMKMDTTAAWMREMMNGVCSMAFSA